MWSKSYTLDFGATGDTVKQGVDKLEDNVDAIITYLNLLRNTFTGATAPTSPDTGQFWIDTNVTPTLKYYNGAAWVVVNQLVGNLKLAVNAAVNKLDVFSKSGGAVPSTSHAISVAIPDGTGLVLRTRYAAYLSGTSQFVMADAGNYWSKTTLDAEIKTAWVYAIWDANGGIVWALGGYSGFHMVPVTTTITDDDYFLLESGSSYTRAATDYCVCVGKIRYQYDTGDTPDHTIQATVENSPKIIYNPPSDYGYQKNLGTTATAEAAIVAYSAVSVVVKQAGKYLIFGHVTGSGEGATNTLGFALKTGSATYGSATQKSSSAATDATAGASLECNGHAIVYLNNGDTIHLGAAMDSASDTRTIYGDNSNIGATALSFRRVD
jgi:hypothetical protein